MKHLHEEAQLIGSMCLGKPRQCRHAADEQARILAACKRNIIIIISSQNKNFQEASASRSGREARVTVVPYVKEAKPSVQRVWKAVFCLPGHVQAQHSSQANCPISGGLSRRRGTQRCLSRLDPPRLPRPGGGQRLGRQVFASQEGTGHFDVR